MGWFKKAFSIVVAVAIPFVAPVIASTIGLSAAIGSVAGSAVVGATIGGLSAKATGGDWRTGALTGGISGGVGGYFDAGPAAVSAPPPPTPTGSALTFDYGYGASGYGFPTATTTASAVPATLPATISPTAVTPSVTGYTYDAFGNVVAAGGEAGGALAGLQPSATSPLFTPTAASSTADLGAQLSGIDGAFAAPSPVAAPVAAPAAVAPTAAAAPTAAPAAAGYTYDMGGNIVPAGGSAGGAVAGLTATPATSLTSAPGTIPAAAAAPMTFAEAVKQVPAEIGKKFTDPKALAEMTLRGVASLAGAASAGTGLTPQEQQLLQAQTEELQWLRENNLEAYNLRVEEAKKLFGMSDYFDPEYFGRQAAATAQIKGGRAKRAGLRGLTGRSRAVAERQIDLATGREAGLAFDAGSQRAMQNRIMTQEAGLRYLPNPSSYTTASQYGNIANAYSNAENRRRQAASDAGGLFGSIMGIPQSQSLG